MASPSPAVEPSANDRHIVVISEPARQAAIRSRFAPTTAVDLFSVADLSEALSFSMSRRPQIVAIDAPFARTARGRTLINTLLKNGTLAGCEIRVVTPAEQDAAAFDLDPACRRAVERLRPSGVEVQVDGAAVRLVDVSARGAQVLSAAMLKPNQRLRLTFTRDEATAGAVAVVVWASFEMPSGDAPRYRAGVEFAARSLPDMEAFVDALFPHA